ncbi:Flp pilus assembly protein CpaB [Nocardioides sp.]|uniref:Flp pilus assembly protein CpaB n=1 Tax=Nocardioides sp. TaxID=35761 RepID=UPI002BDBC34C|nr:Flp pilus assembly protein CpaB [Nocardioides sp.]HXH77987.1 Flp pilus assembly protein CpaB [Nocardioides sp.]
MARRSVLLLVAVIIALAGTALIVVYVQGIDQRAQEGQEMVEVLVASATIESGEDVTDASEAGKFETREVRRADFVDGALTTTQGIQDSVALGTIFPGEQILAAKFGSQSDSESLVIPDDKLAVSVELSDPERVAGFVNPGSDVAIFMSSDPVLFLPDGTQKTLPPYTRLLLPKVQVIGVGTTSVSATTITTEAGAEVTESVPRTILTVAVNQKDAEKLIYASRNSDVSFALLNKNTKITDQPGVSADQLMPELLRPGQ